MKEERRKEIRQGIGGGRRERKRTICLVEDVLVIFVSPWGA